MNILLNGLDIMKLLGNLNQILMTYKLLTNIRLEEALQLINKLGESDVVNLLHILIIFN